MVNYDKQQPESIEALFGSIAKRYDLANAVLSLGLHHYWNRQLLRQVVLPHPPTLLLDLCGGTGDIAFSYLKKKRNPLAKVILLDFCQEMLDYAKHKAEKYPLDSQAITYIKADAQAIPLPDSSIPCATMAYGIRNIQDPALCLKEVFRVLQPGGCFGVLELTRPTSSLMLAGHHFYLKVILPLVGKWITANEQAYRYLCRSIHHFIPPATLENLFKAAGFQQTKQIKLSGGIATIVLGYK